MHSLAKTSNSTLKHFDYPGEEISVSIVFDSPDNSIRAEISELCDMCGR